MVHKVLINITVVLILVSAAAPAVEAQTWSVGVTAGALPLRDFHLVESTFGSIEPYLTRSPPNRFLIGPTVRLRLPSGLGFEAGALRKGIDFDYAFGRPGTAFTQYHAEAAAWQFPLLLQYGFFQGGSSRRRMTPYLGAGAAIRRITGGEQIGENCVQLPTMECTAFRRTELPELENPTTGGVVFGAGVEFTAGFIQLSPEVRYTRWLSRPFSAPLAEENQIEVLVRIAGKISK
jgi:hypothetical protein